MASVRLIGDAATRLREARCQAMVHSCRSERSSRVVLSCAVSGAARPGAGEWWCSKAGESAWWDRADSSNLLRANEITRSGRADPHTRGNAPQAAVRQTVLRRARPIFLPPGMIEPRWHATRIP